MRLVTFELSSPLGPVRRTGALHDDEVFDLCWARAVQHASLGRPRHRQLAEAEVPSDMLELLQGGEYSLEAAREAIDYISLSGDATLDGATIRHAVGDVRLLVPLPRPNSLRPCIATPDEFSVTDSKLEARVDGETWSSGTLANMHFSFPQIIEYITQEADIVPGDLLGSGTIGLGCGFKTDRYLSPGMTVELEAEGIGALRNAVGEKRPRSQIGAPRE
jgi:hypothetical protein